MEVYLFDSINVQKEEEILSRKSIVDLFNQKLLFLLLKFNI